MNNLPKNRRDMIDLLHAAMNAHPPTSGEPPDNDINEEHLALLVSGQLDLLPEAQRQQLLRQVACTPWVAELVADVQRLGLDQVAAVRDATPANYRFAYFSRIGLAVAAMLVVSLGVWRYADPPMRGGSVLHMMEVHEQPSYWDQWDHQQQEERIFRDHLRDYALLASSGACLLLAIPTVWLVIRGMRRKNKEGS